MEANEGRVIEGSVGVWLTEYDRRVGPMELVEWEPKRLIGSVQLTANDMSKHGWTRIGTAQVCIQFNAPQEILSEKVEALKAQKQNILAEAQKKATDLEGQIQKLLAISFDGSAS